MVSEKKCAVFKADGRTHVVYAVQEQLTTAAENYIPTGVPFIVINVEDLPPRETRENWSFDYSNPAGVGKNNAYIKTQ